MISVKNLQRLDAASALNILLAYVKRHIGFKNSKAEIRLRKIFSFLIENDCRLICREEDHFIARAKRSGLSEIKFHIRENDFADSTVFKHIFSQNAYGTLADLVLKTSGPGQVKYILDGGANVGFASVFFANRFPNSKILAVEPEAGNYKLLTRNLEINGLSERVKSIHGGLWSESRKLTIRNDFRSGTSDSFYLSESGKEEDRIQTYTIPELMNAHGFKTIDILKLDIEGAELRLFTGKDIQQVLSLTKFIAVEIHDEFNARDHIYSMLDAAGFSYFEDGELTIGYNKNHLQANA